MTFEDRITIATPEGVDLDLPLAGLGSRFVATLIDVLVYGIPIIALVLVGFGSGNGFVLAITVVAVFATILGFDIAFETLNRGRTPGKALLRIRVVRAGGGPVRFLDSAVRNLLRLIDWLPSLYTIGLIAILVSERNQRLGDLAVGTLVVRDHPPAPVWSTPGTGVGVHPHAADWDVSAIGDDEVRALRRFLERRDELAPDARGHLATELARRVVPRVAGPSGTEPPEFVLEQIVAVKAARRA